MQRVPITWVLVADGKQAQVYEYKISQVQIPLAGNAIHHHYRENYRHELFPVAGMSWHAESIKKYETGKDILGRVFESATTAHHMMEPHTDIMEEIKQHLMQKIADSINTAYDEKYFGRLILIAPVKMLEEIKQYLQRPVLERISAELPKDLVKYDRISLALKVEEMLQHYQ